MQSQDMVSKASLRECYDVTDECIGQGVNGFIKTLVGKEEWKEFALKTLKVENEHQMEFVNAEIISFRVGLGNENIVQLVDVFQEDQYYHIVMEKLMGGDLFSYCVREGQLTENVSARIIFSLANALKTFHDNGIAHRDVKLDNVFCSGDDDLFPIKLGDFGLSSASQKPCCQDHDNDLFLNRVGSVQYMAPEIAKLYLGGRDHYTKQCDLWSLGVVSYIILSGEVPFYSSESDSCKCGDGVIVQMCKSCLMSVLRSIKRGKFNMDGVWDRISDCAKDLVKNLLKVDPNERYTIDQVLSHPWIRLYN